MPNWYAYLGHGDPTFSGNYAITFVKPNCTTGEEVCAIYLNQNTAIPQGFDPLDPNNPFPPMIQYIADALATQVPQPNFPFEKPFVYLRGPVW